MHAVATREIENRIFTIRGVQVILDRGLAQLYRVETRVLKQAVKRNLLRFPVDFMFELSNEEIEALASQSVIPSKKHLGGAIPFVFTEQGVSMLSSVLTSETAIEVNIIMMRAFVQTRRFLFQNAGIFQRLDTLERRQIATDTKLEMVLDAIEESSVKPKQCIFYDGQIFDAYVFVSALIKSAKKSIILIDNDVDESVLTMVDKRTEGCCAVIYTKSVSKQLALDLEKHNAQYPAIAIKTLADAHDRFLVLDDEVYHIGASLKDLGKKWFAFSKLEKKSFEVLKKLEMQRVETAPPLSRGRRRESSAPERRSCWPRRCAVRTL